MTRQLPYVAGMPVEFLSDDQARRLRRVRGERKHAALTEIDGEARFTGSREVEVIAGGDRLTVRAETVIINHPVPARPDLPGATGARVHDSVGIQHVGPLPKRLVIVVGGYVGLDHPTWTEMRVDA